ncbi:MAG: hypothetical protein AAFS11_02440 [Planctomycetota bacterium]
MSADPAANLRAFLEAQLKDAPAAPEASRFTPTLVADHPFADPILEELLYAFLVWEAGDKKAAPAPAKLAATCVDANELRICLSSEIVAALGSTYPKAAERAERIRATLNDIFDREHEVSLASLATAGKREARQYLDSLEGIPPYVAARTALVALDCHAFPVDDRLRKLLAGESCLPEDETTDSAPGWIERQIRAGEAQPMFVALEHWAADRKPAPRTKKKTSRTTKKSASRKKTTKKASSPKSDG